MIANLALSAAEGPWGRRGGTLGKLQLLPADALALEAAFFQPSPPGNGS